MFQIDGVFGASFFGRDTFMGTVIEDNAILQYFYYRCTFVISGSFQNFHRGSTVNGYTACKEAAACTEAEFGRMERIFNRSIRRGLADKTTF